MVSHDVDGRPAHTPSNRGYGSDVSTFPPRRRGRPVTPPARPSATVDDDFVVVDNDNDDMSVDGAREMDMSTADGAAMQYVASGRSTEDAGKPSQATPTDSTKKNKPWVFEEKVDLARQRQVTLVGRSAKAPFGEWVALEKTKERPRVQSTSSSAAHITGSRPKWMQPPSPLSGGGSKESRTPDCGPADEDFVSGGRERDGRQVWAEHRQQVRREREESITCGVERLCVREVNTEKEPSVLDADNYKDIVEDKERQDDEIGNVWAMRKKSMGARGRNNKAPTSSSRREKRAQPAGSKGEGDMEAEGGRNFWSVDHMVALIRAKRDQDAHLQGMGHAVRVVWSCRPGVQAAESVGDGDAAGDGNEEDESSTKGSSPTTGTGGAFGKRKNMRQQTFEALTECMEKHETVMATAMDSARKRQCSIQVRQCDAMKAEVEVQRKHYAELDDVSKLMCHALLEIAKAIRERQKLTKGGQVFVQFTPSSLCSISVVNFTMSSRGGNRGKKRDSYEGETKVPVKKGRHAAKKMKAVATGPSIGGHVREDSEDWVRDSNVGCADNDFVSYNDVNDVRQAQGGLADGAHGGGGGARIRVTAPPEGQQSGWVQSSPDTPRGQTVPDGEGAANAALQGTVHETDQPHVADAQGGAAVGSSRAAVVGAAPAESREDCDDDEPLANRQRPGNARDTIEATTKLWVDDMRFWNETEGHRLFKLIQEARLYLLAIAGGVTPPEISRSIALPHSTIPQHKIDDESLLKAPKERAIKVQSIALRVIHGWIFKSGSCARGYHAAYGYMLNHAATDIARVMWFGEEWHSCVNPAVCHITLELDIMLPIWFVDAHIEERHEDGEMACYQEATVLRLVGAFTSAITLAEGIDGGLILHDRLRNVADAYWVLLATAMWLMRMSGDNLRSHFDASLFVQLTTKPTSDVHALVIRCALPYPPGSRSCHREDGQADLDVGGTACIHPGLGIVWHHFRI
ncbi:hypothetical protein CBR_g3285 [Chara braunii]|uniref:Uncharacterized protein n=1 Tax=Chara braunii TaxID=69332 RepID=A0A388KFK9_CHABU|nr:hypothetical protein CBR_g3285 [Chara braunii]|eukprot:GBG68743.1 hypothetical protein CBR_g3285 [Chara braunii]